MRETKEEILEDAIRTSIEQNYEIMCLKREIVICVCVIIALGIGYFL